MTYIRQAPGTHLYWSGKPDPGTVSKQLVQLRIRTIISLDEESIGNLYKEIEVIKKNNINWIINHIIPNSPRDGGIRLRGIFLNPILTPIYIHCRQGQDRCGFAIALWGMLREKYAPMVDAQYRSWPRPCQLIKHVEGLTGYGNGITAGAKQQLNNIIGCGQMPKENLTPEQAADIASSDDAVSIVRDMYDSSVGSSIGARSDAGDNVDNLRYFNFIDPDISYPGQVNLRCRKKLWNYILKTANIKEKIELASSPNLSREIIIQLLQLNNKEVNDALLKNPILTKDKNDIVDVGSIDNYTGMSQYMNQPSVAPGAPNAAGPIMPAQPNMI